jgi:TolB-like protein/DNA-binding winged helix-turn-helix (wHTH) protein
MKAHVYRFGGFELDPVTGVLRTGESCTALQEKPLLLLLALLDQPQQVVSREQLRLRMWDNRKVVEFDQGINAAIKKLRDALGESAGRPRFIETVSKKGYRLRLPVVLEALEPSVAPATVEPPRLRRLRWVVPLAVGLLLVWAYAENFFAQARPGIQSLAVLPLQDLSPGGGHGYFADGITEEITTNLAQTLSLRVISRTSVMRYKHTTKSISQIARELGVEAIVEGSVARSGERVTVTVQLIDALEDRHLWAGKYDRRVEDVLATEAEVAGAVARQITGMLQHEHLEAGHAQQGAPAVAAAGQFSKR